MWTGSKVLLKDLDCLCYWMVGAKVGLMEDVVGSCGEARKL